MHATGTSLLRVAEDCASSNTMVHSHAVPCLLAAFNDVCEGPEGFDFRCMFE